MISAQNSKSLLLRQVVFSNPFLRGYGKLLPMHDRRRSARWIVANNVRRLMEGSATLNTQAKVAVRAGIKQRTVGYLLDPETTDMASPKLDTVEKVARAFELEPWVLLVHPESFGEELGRLMQRPPVPNERLEKLGLQTPTGNPPAVRGKRGKKRSLV